MQDHGATHPPRDQHTGQPPPNAPPAEQPMDGSDHAGMDHGGGGMAMQSRVSGPQLSAVTVLTALALAAAFLLSIGRYNLTLSAKEVGGLVMPPGMARPRDTSGASMRDMAAVNPNDVSYTAPANARGDQPLQPRVEDGVKVFDLEASVIKWHILPNVEVLAYAYNHQVPGPRIRVTEGDRVRFNVTNHLPEPTTIHWHGLIVPNAMDGPADITQTPIPPGGHFTYEFTVQQQGAYFYHSHTDVDRQQALGLYGALIIDPRDPADVPAHDQELLVQLGEWTFRNNYTFPAMPMEGAMPNYFTINGKAYPATETVNLKVGQKLLVRFIGSNSVDIHPMHIHGGPFQIVATDGNPVPADQQITKDTVDVGPGERYDVLWTAREPGKWLLHCHINHHTTNDNKEEQGGGGLMLILNVSQ